MSFWDDNIDFIDEYDVPEQNVIDPPIINNSPTPLPNGGEQAAPQPSVESPTVDNSLAEKYRSAFAAAQSPEEHDALAEMFKAELNARQLALPNFGSTESGTLLTDNNALLKGLKNDSFSFNPKMTRSFTDKVEYNLGINLGPSSTANIDSVLTTWESDNGYYLQPDKFGIYRKFKNGIMDSDDAYKVSILDSAYEKAVHDAWADVKSSVENSQVQGSSGTGAGLQGYKQYKVVPVSFNSRNESFYSKLDNLYSLAIKYANGDVALANSLTLQFIRRDKYNGPSWDEVAGVIDNRFIQHITENNPELAQFFSPDLTFTDSSGNVIDFAHFAATLNVQLFFTKSLRSIPVPEKHIDNLSGWAGDLQTFIRDIRNATNNSSDYSVVYQAAYNLFGGQNTTFSMSNLFADTDAVNISKQLSSSPLGSVFRSYYSSNEYQTRMIQFVQNITGDKTINKEKLNSLVGIYTDKYWAMGVEWPLLKGVDVSPNEAIAVRDAFTDRIWDMIELERTKLRHEL